METQSINRNVNRPIEFKGLKAQYIPYAGIALVSNLIGFVIIYLAGINSFVCAGICLTSAATSVGIIYRCSRKYGPYGWAKKLAARKLPKNIYHKNRSIFKALKK